MTESHEIGRVSYEGEVFIKLEDVKYLCQTSAERHQVHGHEHAAETMRNFNSALDMLS